MPRRTWPAKSRKGSDEDDERTSLSACHFDDIQDNEKDLTEKTPNLPVAIYRIFEESWKAPASRSEEKKLKEREKGKEKKKREWGGGGRWGGKRCGIYEDEAKENRRRERIKLKRNMELIWDRGRGRKEGRDTWARWWWDYMKRGRWRILVGESEVGRSEGR